MNAHVSLESQLDELAKQDPLWQIFVDWRAKWYATARPQQIPPDDFTECGYMAGRGFGKLLDVQTPMPTPTGWTRLGDIRDGDKLFDETGAVITVVKAHEPCVPERMYRLTFSDGSTVDAGGEHLWTTLTHRARKQMLRNGVKHVPADWPFYRQELRDSWGNVTGHVGAETLTTDELAATIKHSSRGDLNHCIPTTLPLALPAASLPVDPWLLGYWLGNGSTKRGELTAGSYNGNMDGDHVTVMIGPDAKAVPIPEKGQTRISVKGLTASLRALRVLDNKHVPAAYLRASEHQRLALLQGLCDSDGYAHPQYVEFCSADKALAEAVVELATSLGERPVLSEGRAKLNGKDYGPKYRVIWRGYRHNPFTLPRKRNILRPVGAQAFRQGHRMLVSCEPIKPVLSRCLTVDSPSRLYLAGRGMVPTHNTRVGAEWLAEAAILDPDAYPSAVIAPTYADVQKVCFEGPAGLLNVIPPELVLNYNSSDLIITLFTGAKIFGWTAEKPDRLRGPQHARLWCFTAGTQVTTPTGDRPIESLRPGDVVMTRKGPRRVVSNFSRVADVGRVSFANGAELLGTPDHPVYLPSGWTRMDQLKEGDEACAIIASSGVVSGGIATPADTTSEQTNDCGHAPEDCTEKCGLTTTGRYRRGTTCTTGMKTEETTRSATSSCSATRSTSATTTNLFRSRIGPNALRMWSLVRTAAARWSAKGPGRLRGARSAIPAAQKSSANASASADTAARGSAHAPETSAVSVASTWRPTGRQPVYCLKVEGEPEYFANGILVHNCDEIAAWVNGKATLDMAMMGLRMGAHPQLLWTTTPRPTPLVRDLTKPKEGRVIVRGSTYDNSANLPKVFFEQLEQYEGTALGRQELDGELLDPEESGIIKRSWFRLWPADKRLPKLDFVLMSLDTAFTERTTDRKTNAADPSACTVWGSFTLKNGEKHLLLLDCWQDHLGLPALVKKVKKEAAFTYGDDEDAAIIKPLFGSAKPRTSGRKVDIILIEDKGSGISLRQTLAEEGIEAWAYNPGRADKLARLHVVSHIFARRRVWLPESENHPGKPRTWVEPMLEQLCTFVGEGSTEHDDFVDSTTQAVRLAIDKGLVSAVKPDPTKAKDAPKTGSRNTTAANPYAV